MKTIDEAGFRLPKSAYTIERERIKGALRDLRVGESISYGELSKIAGIDVREYMGLLYKVRDKLISEGVRTECMPGVGVYRLDNDHIARYGNAGLKSAHRKNRREVRKLEVCDFAKIKDPDLRRRAPIELAILGAMACMSDGRLVSARVKGAAGSAKELPKPEDIREMMNI